MRELRGNFSAQESAIIIKESEFNQELQPDEILIKTKACAINLQNEKIYHQLLSNSLENCPIGHSVSGIIVKTGSNVEKYEEDMCVVGYLTIQLAQSFGAKVLSTYRTLTEKQYLENLKAPIDILKDLLDRIEVGEFKMNDIISIQLEKAAEYFSQSQTDLDSTKAIVVVP
ncbi:hypothetical protein PoB_000214500 [Plakobranchus ocellatus]|uniref:Alcohol dehydrogenase-like N-terminal domain-containing protein n=1 Tax=Plakobranchus ocellatus TaxID=259542 RepID=A0AAV3XYY5_9GAST|nr:hypothetical protein PoB_000214500 [Plakobranchus ocellatus]